MRNPIPPRPTVYNGVKMRSRLEAAWAEQFDSWGWAWEYEPSAYATTAGQYLPDFRVHLPGSTAAPMYVEVKPAYWMEQEHWGFKGDYYDVADWNAACAAKDAEIQRLAGIIKANTPMSMFVICTSADDQGKAWIVAARAQALNDTTPLIPVRCRHGCLALVADSWTTCSRHVSAGKWASLLVPIPSLYAPSGFGNYEDGRVYREDEVDLILRGSDL